MTKKKISHNKKTRVPRTVKILRQTSLTFVAELDTGDIRLGLLNGLMLDRSPISFPADMTDEEFDAWITDTGFLTEIA